MKLGKLLEVRLHVLPAQDILSYRHHKWTVTMFTITGIHDSLVRVNVTQIHSLGCQDLLGSGNESDS